MIEGNIHCEVDPTWKPVATLEIDEDRNCYEKYRCSEAIFHDNEEDMAEADGFSEYKVVEWRYGGNRERVAAEILR